MNRHRRIAAILCGSLLLGGCHSASPDGGESQLASQVKTRFGYDTSPPGATGVNEVIFPEGLTEERPLSADHAVLLALWNNPGFHDALAELQLTRADLITADLLPNPEVVYFFNVPDKPFKYALELPLEAIWLRPYRVKIAEAENARARERLTQLAFDLIRDTRQAYIDVALAKNRVAVAEIALKVRGRIAELAEARLKAGDASVQEVTTARIDALQAGQDATRIRFELPLAEERLKNLMGVPKIAGSIPVANPATIKHPAISVEALVDDATHHRPDGLAAQHARVAAEERLRFSKLSWVRVLGIADATSGRKTGHEFGPALRMTLPIFNQNQGGIARAEAEVEQLTRRELVIRIQIITDVRTAAVRYEQARSEYETLIKKVKSEVEAGIQRSQKAYEDGNAGYLIVLETTRQLIDTNNREAQLKADLQRAWADLERSVGRRLLFETPPSDNP